MAFYLVAFAVAFAAFVYYLWERNQFFVRQGIVGPKPWILTGNWEWGLTEFGLQMVYTKWGKVFGKTYGLMEGGQPVLVTSDVGIIKEVFNKQFANFHGRKRYPMTADPADTKEDSCILLAEGTRWKRQRSIINQCFTTGHIKEIYPMICSRADVFVDILLKRSQHGLKPVAVYPALSSFATDVIAKIVFADEENLQEKTSNMYTEILENMASAQFAKTTITLFPEIGYPLQTFFIILMVLSGKAGSFLSFFGKLEKKVDARRELNKTSNVVKTDYMQYFLDTIGDEEELGKDNVMKTQEKKLTNGEIIKNLHLLLFAGADTTASTLAFAIMLLSRRPDAQDILIREIDAAMGEKQKDIESIPYDVLDTLPYLDATLKECQRLYPHATGIHNRRCSKATTVTTCDGQTIDIPVGMVIQSDTWNMQRNPEYWGDDAEEFKPERWLQKEKPYTNPLAYIPMGAGKRLCVGARLANIQMKMVMIKVFRSVSFSICEENTGEIRIGGIGAVQPLNSEVSITPRRFRTESCAGA